MKLSKILSSSKGLTLVEVLASLTILGIILIGTMKFFSQAYSYTNMNQKKTAAINVARNALMYIEKDNYISVRDKFEKNPDEKVTILICEDPVDKEKKYELFWKDELVEQGCEPIEINNVKYNVSIEADKEELSNINYNDTRSYYFPLKTIVSWTINGKENSTQLEGAIKSEDIR